MPLVLTDCASLAPHGALNLATTEDDKRSSFRVIHASATVSGYFQAIEIHSLSPDPELGADSFPLWDFAYSPTIDPIEEEFRQQKESFLERAAREPLFIAPYQDQFVASRDGQIVDSDNDLDALTDRFFRIHGNVPVYITRIGEEVADQIVTPFFED